MHYPDTYYDVFFELLKVSSEQDVTKEYLENIAKEHQLDLAILRSEPTIDVNYLTKEYVEGLGVELVPTVIVNSVKVVDPFSLEEIEGLLNNNK